MGNKHARDQLAALEGNEVRTPEIARAKLLDPRSPDQKRTPILDGDNEGGGGSDSPYQPPRRQKKVLPKRFPQGDKENRMQN